MFALSTVVMLSFAGGVDEPPRSLTYQFAALGWEFRICQERFVRESRRVGLDLERLGPINKAYLDDHARIRRRVETLIKANPGNPTCFQGILLISGTMSYPPDEDIRWLVGKYYLDEPRLGRLCFDVRHRTHPLDRTWVRELIENACKSPHREVRGQAAFALGDFYRRLAMPDDEPPPEAVKADYLNLATRYFDEVLKIYSDVLTPNGKDTLGSKVAVELACIRNFPDLKVGRPAPDIGGMDLDGQPLKLSDYQGKVVVLVFWQGTERLWGRTLLDSPDLLRVVRALPCTVLGVAYDDGGREFARTTVAKAKFPGPIWWDVEYGGPLQSAYNIGGLPTTFLLDRAGTIRGINLKHEDLGPAVRDLLAEPK